MSDKKAFYITSTLPYVNAEPHVGFAMELIRADIITRFKKAEEFDVFFNTGTDEHGQKLFTAAQEKGIPVEEYVDGYAQSFKNLPHILGVSSDVHFIRTTDTKHVLAAQAFWKLCDKNGYIYKKNYEVKYCVGCELEKTDSELVDGKCTLHPNLTIELISEENYFFKFSAFEEKLLAFYEAHPTFVIPDFRYNEIKAFVARGLEDFSISRLKTKMSWGVEVPTDPDHVMYVWFDALVSYISTLGWFTPSVVEGLTTDGVEGSFDNTQDKLNLFDKFWVHGTPTQYAGKDNLRQQSAMWQAMLMSAGLPNSNQIVINGFVTGDGGIKMSKSLGNVINPLDVVNEYGAEALRYFVAREVSTFEDSPFTLERFKDTYNSGLANGLGNLTSRIMKMVESYGVKLEDYTHVQNPEIKSYLEKFEIKLAIDEIWKTIVMMDGFIQTEAPFKKIKVDEATAKQDVQKLLGWLMDVALELAPFLPETSEKIIALIKENKSPSAPLFARKD